MSGNNNKPKSAIVDWRERISLDPDWHPETFSSMPEPALYLDGLPWVPIPKKFMIVIELLAATGISWRFTSFIRNSPNHKIGNAIDLAPFSLERVPNAYGYLAGVDPLLTQRPLVLEYLTKVAINGPDGLGYFLETDHIHLNLLANPHARSFVGRMPGPREDLVPSAAQDFRNGRGHHVLPESKMAAIWPADYVTYNNPWQDYDLEFIGRGEWQHFIKRS